MSGQYTFVTASNATLSLAPRDKTTVRLSLSLASRGLPLKIDITPQELTQWAAIFKLAAAEARGFDE